MLSRLPRLRRWWKLIRVLEEKTSLDSLLKLETRCILLDPEFPECLQPQIKSFCCCHCSEQLLISKATHSSVKLYSVKHSAEDTLATYHKSSISFGLQKQWLIIKQDACFLKCYCPGTDKTKCSCNGGHQNVLGVAHRLSQRRERMCLYCLLSSSFRIVVSAPVPIHRTQQIMSVYQM